MNYCPDCGCKLTNGEHPVDEEPAPDAVAEVATAGIEAVRDVAVAAVTADALSDAADAAAEVGVAEAQAAGDVAEELSEVAVAQEVADAGDGDEVAEPHDETPDDGEPEGGEPGADAEEPDPGEEEAHVEEGSEPEPIMVAPPQHEDRAPSSARAARSAPAFRRRRRVRTR